MINVHYLAEKITGHCGDGSAYSVHIPYSHEPQLLGTAGAVRRMEALRRDGPFLVLCGDHLVHIPFAPLIEFHRAKRALATMALFESDEPGTGGVVETDADGRVTRFVKKPSLEESRTNLTNAAIYVLDPGILDRIPPATSYDIGNDVFPRLLAEGNPIYAMKLDGYLCDTGTPERLARAQEDNRIRYGSSHPHVTGSSQPRTFDYDADAVAHLAGDRRHQQRSRPSPPTRSCCRRIGWQDRRGGRRRQPGHS